MPTYHHMASLVSWNAASFTLSASPVFNNSKSLSNSMIQLSAFSGSFPPTKVGGCILQDHSMEAPSSVFPSLELPPSCHEVIAIFSASNVPLRNSALASWPSKSSKLGVLLLGGIQHMENLTLDTNAQPMTQICGSHVTPMVSYVSHLSYTWLVVLWYHQSCHAPFQ